MSYFAADLGGAKTEIGTEGKREDLGLFTNNKQRIRELDNKTLSSILLHCGCSSNVAGVGWWNSYLDTLPLNMKIKVKVSPSEGKRFGFRGEEVLPARRLVKFPSRLANMNIMFTSHIVNSDIPMLWSRTGMARHRCFAVF